VHKHYWMQPMKSAWNVKDWNDWGAWPTDILIKVGVQSDNLGVVVRLDNQYPGDGRVAPVVVHPAKTPPERVIEKYTAIFLSGTAYSSGSYELRGGCSGTGDIVKPGKLGQQRPGFDFSVDLDLTKREAGEYQLILSLIRAVPAETGPPTGRGVQAEVVQHKYCFDHQPIRKFR